LNAHFDLAKLRVRALSSSPEVVRENSRSGKITAERIFCGINTPASLRKR